jgi:hypothetical protein
MCRYAAAAIAKVFAGTPPAKSFHQPQRFEVVLNLAAKGIGVKLPHRCSHVHLWSRNGRDWSVEFSGVTAASSRASSSSARRAPVMTAH